jgi:uncharacterized membrane protein
MLPFADFMIALKWYAVLFLLGLIGWALMLRRSQPLPDKGYGLGKAIGLITVGAVSWILSVIGLLPFTGLFLWLLVLVGFGVVFYRRQELLKTFKKHWKKMLVVEIVCLLLFFGATLLRAQNPQINGIEKFMDSAILNGLLRDRTGAPKDVWYAGQPINYYYFGHWMVATAAKLSGTDGARAFTLGFATVVATAGTSLFLVGWTLAKRIFGGILVLFLALFASNWQPFFALVKHQQNYFFFSSGRFSIFRINEYPMYSFSLGDLHAHMLSLILTTALVVIAVLYIKNAKFVRSNAAIMGALLGLMAATNSFDTVTCGLLVAAVLLAKWYRTVKQPPEALWHPVLFCAAGAIIPLVVFLANFTQPTGGAGIALFKIPIGHILMQFGGPLLLLVLCAAAYVFLRPARKLPSLKKMDENALLLLIFGTVAVVLILVPEVIFLKDIYYYTNPPYELANTVFKVWYTGWILLAVTAGSATVRSLGYARKTKFLLPGVFALLAVCAILIVGTFKGIGTVKDFVPPTINGQSYLQGITPDKYSVAQWANQHITGQPTVLEASGDSYSQNDWFSAYTGLPTIIGWRSHEWGWRYSDSEWPTISARAGTVQNIYASTSAASLRQQTKANNVQYVLLGPDEITAYGANPDIFAQAFGQPVYKTPSIALYRVN